VKLLKSILFCSAFIVVNNGAAAPSLTLQQAVNEVQKVIKNIPQDSSKMQQYEKEQSDIMLRCTQLLYKNARKIILQTLREIEQRMAYWHYQKDHPWNYFISKNPMKWIRGQSQAEEIEHNSEQLQSHQGELFVLLGQLAQQNNLFIAGYKNNFLQDYNQGYVWIDGMLRLLARIQTDKVENKTDSFFARATLLQKKLQHVHHFKTDLLADIDDTKMPNFVERNWLKYSAAALVGWYGYNKGAVGALQTSATAVKSNVSHYVVTPVVDIVQDLLGTNVLRKQEEGSLSDIVVAKESIKNFLNTVSSFDATAEEKQAILNEVNNGETARFQALTDKLSRSWWTQRQGLEALGLWSKLFALQSAKQYTAVGKIVLLIPAAFAGLLAYGPYTSYMTSDYSALRRKLIDINMLFVDQTKPLDDERYGKMVYLIDNTKKLANTLLPTTKNIRADFIADLDTIESNEFDVAAKHRIIDIMFKKYSLLGSSAKKNTA
jgi:hypothetical protein